MLNVWAGQRTLDIVGQREEGKGEVAIACVF